MTKEEIISQWEYMVNLLDRMIEVSSKQDDMLTIMIARKNQLLECIADIKKLAI